MKYIYQHLGLGDHIVCNGAVRTIINDSENYIMFVKPSYKDSVEFMYRDLENLKFLPGDDDFVKDFLRNIRIDDLILIGHIYQENWYETFEKMFYQQVNVPFHLKWENFKCIRDFEREKNLFEMLNLKPDDDYIFVHDDDRYQIDMSRINSTSRVIKPIVGLTSNIFDYCGVIENAKEVHGIESSFAFLIDQMDINKNFSAHRYVKSHLNTPFGIPEYRNVKEIYK